MANPDSKLGSILGTIADVAETAGAVAESADKVSSSGGSLLERLAAGHRRRVQARNASKAVKLDGKAKRLRAKASTILNPARRERVLNRAVRAETAADIARDIALGFAKLDGTSLLEPGDTPGRLDV